MWFLKQDLTRHSEAHYGLGRHIGTLSMENVVKSLEVWDPNVYDSPSLHRLWLTCYECSLYSVPSSAITLA